VNVVDLENLIEQLPRPYIILGDLNAHNTVWGSGNSDARGRMLENLFLQHDLCILNDASPTYLHPGSGTLTCIDLTVCVPGLLNDFKWSVSSDLRGSDHFPIILKSDRPSLGRPRRWRLGRADWDKFEERCSQDINEDVLREQRPVDTFTDILLGIAKECIPQTSLNPRRPSKPWFDAACKNAIKDRKKRLASYIKNPSQENLTLFKIARAKARHTIRSAKRNSWRDFVSRLDSRVSAKTVWKAVRRVKGKEPNAIGHLKDQGRSVTSPKDIANCLASSIADKSSTDHYTPEFRRIKIREERHPINFNSNNSEDYNQPFSLEELRDSLYKSHDTAPGWDEIHYQFLKHLPESSLKILLSIFNSLWEAGRFPDNWRKATVIPIVKPGKDGSDPSSYRPIALTSCICKTMERMINNRLVWFLEKNKLLSNYQCGFRHGRTTIDHLVRLESFVRNALLRREHLVAVFFDIEKAYDTTWKHGILRDLHLMGLRGHLPCFIREFLQNRIFQVRVGNCTSDPHGQEMGVPQGSILSVTLFNVKINSIVQSLSPGTDCSLYVDDFLICFNAKCMHTIERKLQLCLNKLQNWANNNGFKFSDSKTVGMHFCNLRGPHPDPDLFLGKKKIPIVKTTKFLGITLDSKFTFVPHIRELKKKCLKALNILKVLSNTDWGADRDTLLLLYRSLIRSKLDYGSFLYGAARKSYLKILEPVQNAALRLCLGAFRTSPISSLHVEAGEIPMDLRRKRLAMQYLVKLKANPSNPAFDPVFNPPNVELFDRRPNVIQPLGLRMREPLKNLTPHISIISKSDIIETPPWLIEKPKLDLSLAKFKKENLDPHTFQTLFRELQDDYGDCGTIYTDGSKMDGRVACACWYRNKAISRRLPDGCSIFTAELHAILLALLAVKESSRKKFIICSDSKSALQALNRMKVDIPLVSKCLKLLWGLRTGATDITFVWVPSHVGIWGNEAADREAKKALNKVITKTFICYTDLKPCIAEVSYREWQTRWETEINNKLVQIKEKVKSQSTCRGSTRRKDVLITRLKIGHTYFTHSFLLKGQEPPRCIGCDCSLTVEHFLLHCPDFSDIRAKYFNVYSLKLLFEIVDPDRIYRYVNELGLLSKM
jgi:ribonuclease HI